MGKERVNNLLLTIDKKESLVYSKPSLFIKKELVMKGYGAPFVGLLICAFFVLYPKYFGSREDFLRMTDWTIFPAIVFTVMLVMNFALNRRIKKGTARKMREVGFIARAGIIFVLSVGIWKIYDDTVRQQIIHLGFGTFACGLFGILFGMEFLTSFFKIEKTTAQNKTKRKPIEDVSEVD